MIRRLYYMVANLLSFIWVKFSPIGYARHLGVKLGENIRFFSMKPFMFGGEPWLITIGNDCFISANCTFVTHDGGILILRKEIPDLELTSPITIGNDVYIGINTTIMPGTKIGNRCIIGACSLVKGEFADNSVIAGTPARVIKTVDEYLEKAKRNSLHYGNLSQSAKAQKLKEHFGVS